MGNRSKLVLMTAIVFGCIVLTGGCSPVVVANTSREKTSECEYMDEVCNDAQRFRAEYGQLSDEDKRDMKEVLIALETQCEEAARRCKKSQTRREK